MIKNIERQRAKKIYKKEQEEDPPGVSLMVKISLIYTRYLQDRSQPAVIACKRSEFNHFPGKFS